MRKKVKQIFRKKQNLQQSGKKCTMPPANVDICSVNIVCEAEKIIEEYACKMGYKIAEKKPSKAPIFVGILVAASAFMLLSLFALKVFFV